MNSRLNRPFPFTVDLAALARAVRVVQEWRDHLATFGGLPAPLDDAIETIKNAAHEIPIELDFARADREELFAAINPEAADVYAAIESLQAERDAYALLKRVMDRREKGSTP